jgi:protein gp37
MSASSSIEWTDATWNPTRGCTRVSEGCRNCYAEMMAARFSDPGQWGHGFAEMKAGDHRWTGKVELIESQLLLPLHWRKPRKIFVNSTSDLFHESLPDEAIDRVFAVMALCPQHTFQVLTKRPERMQAWAQRNATGGHIFHVASTIGKPLSGIWPLPNVWHGTSIEDQATADERIPRLLQAPAAIRFVSYEPALGPVDFRRIVSETHQIDTLRGWVKFDRPSPDDFRYLDWIIVGGESGSNARPMHPDWARSVRDQCSAACVAFFFKQWGEWARHKVVAGGDLGGDVRAGRVRIVHPSGRSDVEVAEATGGRNTEPGSRYMARVGKARSGRLLDGVNHNAFPETHQKRQAA